MVSLFKARIQRHQVRSNSVLFPIALVPSNMGMVMGTGILPAQWVAINRTCSKAMEAVMVATSSRCAWPYGSFATTVPVGSIRNFFPHQVMLC